ncbi:EpsG family protein [Shewanella sp. MEBiC00475]|uniref:EpsG family protein n=1 Tax=Shewanella sp. MEBiC00475 TaxID=2575361 RepID=UPI0010C0E9E6|nr:EpsG family protein [Shewanella sp. MEBiC00475]
MEKILDSKEYYGEANNKNISLLFFYMFIFVFSFAAPFFSFICCTILVIYTNDYKFIKTLPIALVMFFVVINFNKDFFYQGNDLLWYYSYFKNFSDYQLGFFSAFQDDNLATVTLKSSEPFYHLLVYASSKLTNGYYPFYITMIHSIIYLVPTFVIINICKIERVPVLICLSLVLFQMLVFYDFGNAYNMIRQQVASSFVVLSFYFMYVKKPQLCLFFCVISIFTHNSTVIVVALIFLFCLYNLNYLSYKVVVFTSSILSFIYILLYFKISGDYEDLQDQSRGLALQLLDFILFFLSGIIVFFYDSKYRHIYKFIFIFFIALSFSYASSFLPLRFLTFYDSFKWLVYFILLNFLSSKLIRYKSADFFILLISTSLAFIYFNLKLTYTTYYYSGTFIKFVFDSPVFYLGTNL